MNFIHKYLTKVESKALQVFNIYFILKNVKNVLFLFYVKMFNIHFSYMA